MLNKILVSSILAVILLSVSFTANSAFGDDTKKADDKKKDAKKTDKKKDAKITAKQAQYTVLVYMVGSDLESEGYAATSDLNEMMKVGSSSSINVIVESGGSKAKPDEERKVDFTSIKRLLINKGNIKQIADLGKKNMGDPSTLSDFVVWGTKTYPAKNFVLVMWDHGSGIEGFGHDENFNDNLSLDELQKAFADAKKQNKNLNFEVMGFDACLMATIEVADIAKDYAKYMVASEELEPGHGWDYTAILSSLSKTPNQDGKKLGKTIADSYVSHAKSEAKKDRTAADRLVTLSVIDLSKINTLGQSIDTLAGSLDTALTYENFDLLSESLSNSERYGVEKDRDSGHTDIKDMVNNIGSLIPEVKAKTEDVKKKISDAVTYSIKGALRPNSNGISIYQPLTEENSQDYSYEDEGWDAVTDDYETYLEQDTIIPEVSAEFYGNKIVGSFAGDDIYSFNVYITSEEDDDGILEIFSTEEYDPEEFPNGEFEIDWGGTIPALCNSKDCSPINPEYEYDDSVTLAYIPVRIQSEDIDTDADLIYDVSSDTPIFIGAWPDDEDESVYQRNILPLYEGDLIYTYTEDYNTQTDESEFIPYDDPITVDESFELTESSFPGKYWIQVEVCDYSENCAYSDYFEFKVKE